MKDLIDRVTEAERARERFDRERPRPWREVLRAGSLGWLVALPVVGGALAGHWLDVRLGTGIRWSLAGLLAGLTIAGFALYRHATDGGRGGGR